MPDPTELLLVARQLSGSKGSNAPTDAHLRRAVSTAYYALFHTILRAAADNKAALSEKYRQALRRDSVSQHMRDVATYFPYLQNLRHQADYHPSVAFRQSDVASVIDSTLAAMIAFNTATPAEQADILALLMVGIRR